MSLREAFWLLNESAGSFLATKLIYGKLSGLSRADPQSSSSSGGGELLLPWPAVAIVSRPPPPKKNMWSCSRFPPPPTKKRCEVVVVRRGEGGRRTTTTLARVYWKLSGLHHFFLPQFIRISSDSFVYLPSSIFFLPQFSRISFNSFVYLPSSIFVSPNSFVYLLLHSYIFLPVFFPPIHSYIL